MSNSYPEVIRALEKACDSLESASKAIKEASKIASVNIQVIHDSIPAKCIDGSRRGKFCLPYDMLDYNRGGWKKYIGVFDGLVVLDAKLNDGKIEYIALGMQFDPVPEGQKSPNYHVVVGDGPNRSHITWLRAV